MSIGKLPPQATDLEEAVLGAIMLEKGAYNKISDFLSPESFYNSNHSEIYKAMSSLFSKSSAIDILTVTAELKQMGTIKGENIPFLVTSLTSRIASAANIEDHAKIIEQKFIQRELINVCNQTIKNAYDDTTDVFDLIEYHQAEVYNSVKGSYGRNDIHISEAVKDRIKEYSKGKLTGITGVGTGFKSLDKFTGGWQKSDLIIIAARPAMGKTALAIETAKYAALNHNTPVGIFSLEMSNAQLTDRLISSVSGIFQDTIKKRDLNFEDLDTIKESTIKLSNSQIYMDDTPGLSITALRSKAIRMKERYDIGLLVVDYLQLMDGAKDKGTSREQEIGKISRGLKIIAKELEIPVIALSQLSRAVESRSGNGKRPMLSDLRESGSIEQDADQVIFLYRPEYYDITEDEEGRSTAGICELIFGKNRNGTTETIPLRFNGALMRFKDLEGVSNDVCF